ncbi:MAG: YihY/virulence factor BrkB family protein [Muribaculaceae bacterium]|nr:YihY/virulence factor BrkB family protein [Muribaculaceae bacterium]
MAKSLARLTDRTLAFARYCWNGVWRDPRDTFKVRLIKTLNLSVRSFMDRDLQMKSAALTYSTVLAIVPALALLFAIGRGFGFQDLLAANIFSYFPSQHKALETAITFVDSYLKEASGGVFVGIGILMLLWTLISLLSTIEEAFNNVWDIKKDRTMYQKITDYIAICLMIPILMVCSSGVSIFMSTIVQSNVHLAFLSPLINITLELSPLVLAWLAFTLSYFLIPNTKVHFKYAAISGAICAIAFQILQLLFVNGQIYVSKYNAIYGSFSFLPLMLIWLQLSWLVLLFGCVLTYAMQNIFAFNFLGNVSNVSQDYHRKIAVVVTTAIFQRFKEGKTPLSRNQISTIYDIPIRLVTELTYMLQQTGVIYYVMLKDDVVGFAPAVEINDFTLGDLFRKLDNYGDSDFIPLFNKLYPNIVKTMDEWNEHAWDLADKRLIVELNIPTASEIK